MKYLVVFALAACSLGMGPIGLYRSTGALESYASCEVRSVFDWPNAIQLETREEQLEERTVSFQTTLDFDPLKGILYLPNHLALEVPLDARITIFFGDETEASADTFFERAPYLAESTATIIARYREHWVGNRRERVLLAATIHILRDE